MHESQGKYLHHTGPQLGAPCGGTLGSAGPSVGGLNQINGAPHVGRLQGQLRLLDEILSLQRDQATRLEQLGSRLMGEMPSDPVAGGQPAAPAQGETGTLEQFVAMLIAGLERQNRAIARLEQL